MADEKLETLRVWGTQDDPRKVLLVSDTGYMVRVPLAVILRAARCACEHEIHAGPCHDCGCIAFLVRREANNA